MDQLLVALDVDSADEAIELSNQLRDVVGGFKIGSRLFTAEGPAVVHKMVKRGDKIFLDLKNPYYNFSYREEVCNLIILFLGSSAFNT